MKSRNTSFPRLCLLVAAVAGWLASSAGAASPAGRFFPSCHLDLSSRLSAPAGSRGFVFSGSDGHFYCADGSRLRFWGVNVAKDSITQPHETIDRVADVFAQAGLNLVRLHHFDEALLPPDRAGQAERMDPAVLDSLDYWIYACKRRGIYVYLDLLDYRTFCAAEGVPAADKLERAAKPVSVFNERLINLQMSYARELFALHVNPYTGLSYRDDPAICLLEICDENGLFALRNRWGLIPSPYREELIRRWNFWLRTNYGTSAALTAAWRNGTQGGLGPTESLEDGTVGLPGVSPQVQNEPQRDPDLRRFAAGVERDYLRQMVSFLHSIGVHIPISAVMQPDSPASLLASADTLDYLAANYYFGHPIYKTTYAPGVHACYEAGDVLDATGPDTAVRRLAGPQVEGKPLIIREWNVCWPNPNRAAGMLEVAALAARQDIDGMILFSFYTQPDSTSLSPFDISGDQASWGMMALAGEVFREESLRPGGPRLAVVWSPQALYTYASGALAGPLYDLAWGVGMKNWLPGHLGQRADLYAVMGAGGGDLIPAGTDPANVVTQENQDPALAALQYRLDGKLAGTRQLAYDANHDLLRIEGSRVLALAGHLDKEVRTSDDALRWTSVSPRAALVWLSLDGLPAGQSRHWMAKMVTGAWNTGERTQPHYHTDHVNLYELLAPGTAPITTGGKPNEAPTVLTLGGQAVLRLWLRGGTWELEEDGGKRRLYCDTPGVQFEFPDASGAPLAEVTGLDPAALSGPPWVFPEQAAWVEAPVKN